MLVDMSKWVPTCKSTRVTWKWVELSLTHLIYGLNGFEPSWRWVDPLNPPTIFYDFL